MSIGRAKARRGGIGVLGAALLALALGAMGCAASAVAAPPTWPTAIAAHSAEYSRLKREAQQVTITRDTWSIPHVHGQTDAAAVFGALYAQCEDDFSRVQRNWLTALGWNAQLDGESAVWSDLGEQLFVDPAALKREYAESPAWLQRLMQAWADGINWYLATHPDAHPEVIRHYEPWMALSFTDGNAGSDVQMYVDVAKLAKFYGRKPRDKPHTGAARTARLGRRWRIQRDRDRAQTYRGRPCVAAHQPARDVLLARRAANDQRRRPRRLRRRHLGAVLRLPGLQPSRRLDAHLIGCR